MCLRPKGQVKVIALRLYVGHVGPNHGNGQRDAFCFFSDRRLSSYRLRPNIRDAKSMVRGRKEVGDV